VQDQLAPSPPPEDLGIQEIAQRPSRNEVVAVAFAAIAILALAVIGYGVFRNGGSEPPGLVFVIPAGSKEGLIPEFDSAVEIPTSIVFGPDDDAAISIVNEDDVAHRAGPFLVGPKQTYLQRFDRPGEYPLVCIVDPAESIVVTVKA
jgi:hypothetical protein